MVDLADLATLTLLVAGVLYWWRAQGVRELAVNAVRAYCRAAEVQWLDETVALRGFWLKRNPKGRFCIWRSYNFEFTDTGEQRHQGRIILLGRQVEAIQLKPDWLH